MSDLERKLFHPDQIKKDTEEMRERSSTSDFKMNGDDFFENRVFDVRGCEEYPQGDCWIWQSYDGGPDGGAWHGPWADWNHSHYEKILEHVDNYSAVVTAGANMGMYVRPYSMMFDLVFAFEPEVFNFNTLVRNNLRENVCCFRAGLWSQASWCHVNRVGGTNAGMHTISHNESANVPLMTIDSLRLQNCGLIQLDVEGCEFQALLGARGTIEKCKPVVMAERTSESVSRFLNSFGYKPQDLSIRDTIYTVRKKKE